MNNKLVVRLYVMGYNVRSERAISNLRVVCEEDLDMELDLDIIDVLERPQEAEEDRILATPTLVKVAPEPKRRIIGDLTDREMVSRILQGSSPGLHKSHERNDVNS